MVGFISDLNASVIGKQNPKENEPLTLSPAVQGMMDMIAALRKAIGEFPPVKTPSRFGNPAFRLWHARMEEIVASSTPFVPAVRTG